MATNRPFHAREADPALVRAVPVAADVPGYRPATAGQDVLAGLTVAALALPAGMAYAELAGISPVNGLYALLLPAVAYAALGSSKVLSIGPEGSIAALVAAGILPFVAAGSAEASVLAAALALMVGACFVVAWVGRLGWIADYFSQPVLIGYMHGVAVVLIVGQLGKLFGISVSARDPIPQLAGGVRRPRQRKRGDRRGIGDHARDPVRMPLQAAAHPGRADRRRRHDRAVMVV